MNIYLGGNLKELRCKQNLTQEKLADFLGVSFQTISKWERGDNRPDTTPLSDEFKSTKEFLELVNSLS